MAGRVDADARVAWHRLRSSIVEACARAAYEANRAYCITIGDDSFGPWEQAPDWQTATLRNGIPGALAGDTPEQSHESWLAEKIATGWKCGPVKDPDRKEHPCMVPYADLPEVQRAKYALYLAVVRAVADALEVRRIAMSLRIRVGDEIIVIAGSQPVPVEIIEHRIAESRRRQAERLMRQWDGNPPTIERA